MGGGWQVDDGVRIPSATSAPVTREANPKITNKKKKKLFSVPRSLLFTVTAELSGLHTRETLCVYARGAHEERRRRRRKGFQLSNRVSGRQVIGIPTGQERERENGFHRGIPLAFFFFSCFLHAPQPREKQLISPLKDVNLFRPQLGSPLLVFRWIQDQLWGGGLFFLPPLYLVDSNLFGDSSDFVSCEWKSAFPSSSSFSSLPFQSIGQMNCWLGNESTKMVKSQTFFFFRR